MALHRATPGRHRKLKVDKGRSREVKQLLSVLILVAVIISLAVGGTFADWLEDDHGGYCFYAGEWEVCENEEGSRGWWSQLQPISQGFVTEVQVIGWLNNDISQDSCWLNFIVLDAVFPYGPPLDLNDMLEVLVVGGKTAEGKEYLGLSRLPRYSMRMALLIPSRHGEKSGIIQRQCRSVVFPGQRYPEVVSLARGNGAHRFRRQYRLKGMNCYSIYSLWC